MAELKIRIEGDATGATKALEDVKNSSDFTWKSISQLINNLQKVDKALLNGTATAEDLDKAQRQLVNSFERFANSAIAGGNEVSAYNDIIKKANSVVQKLDANIQSANLSEPFKAAAKSVQKYKDELSATQSKAENTLARNKATALGDNYTLYSLDYKELDSQLTRILQKEGKVTAESQKLANQMVKLKASMDKAGKTDLGTRMKNLAASFISAQAAVWAIQKAFTILKKVMVDSAAAASKAEETANLFNTTFSNIEGTANNVASKLSSSLGVATSSAQQMIGLFGDLAMGYGQTQTAALEFADQAVKTGLDIISFKNLTGDTTELLQSMASGLAGNFENFRKWGIIVTQTEIKQRLAKKGLDKLTGSAYQYAKVQETLAIVQEKSKNAIGDMAKTLESTENINRRLGEANKELLETMGSGINEILNPVKKAWIGIATEINKATKAQKEYAAGSKNIQIYDIANNEKDRKSFASDIKLGADTRIFGYASLDNNDVAMSNFIENAKKQMVIYNATAEETIKVIKESVTLNWKGQLDEISRELREFGETLKKENDANASLETRRSALESANSSARNFLDSLNGITGVNTNVNIAPYSSEVFTRSDNLANVAQNGLARNLEQAIQQAIASLDSSTWKEFADPIKLALGEITEDKGIESKLDAIKSVYELIYNEHLKDGKLTEQESADLEHIASLYKEIQDKQKKNASFSSALESVTKLDKSDKLETLGKSDKDLELFNLKNIKEAAEAIGLTIKQQEELDKAYKQAKATIEEYYEAQEKMEKQKEFDAWNKKISQFGMSEREIQYADLKEGKDNGTYTSDEYEKIKSYMDEFFSLEDAEAKAKEFQSLIDSSFGEAINIFKQMSSSMGWVGMLMELVSQTEAYQELMSVLTDSILPVLNAFLEPLLPMIKMAGDYIMTITQAVLIPLFPVLKKIAWVATFVIGILNVAYGFVADVIKKIVGTIQYGILTVYNWIVRTLQKINIFGWKPFGWMSEADTSQAQDWMNTDIMGNAKDRLNEMNKHLASIDAMTMDIKDNTDKSPDISAYQEMFSKGILSFSEYTALVSKANGRNYDNVYTYQGSEYYKGSGGSTNINYGGIEIRIDGSNLNADQIAEKVQKKLEEKQRAGQKTYA